ncbi:helix-turn-helix transcriptional regulator [Sedimenticola selenatireducens]|nr:helix-turn-helix domain-containing protein [Sedimenticola selenatireducens]
MTNTITAPNDPLMTSDEVAEYLNLAPRTIQKWREDKTGPQFIRINHRCVRYRRLEVDRWLLTLQGQEG